MNLLFRIVLAVYAFCLALISIIAIFFTVVPSQLLASLNFIYQALQSQTVLFTMLIVELVFLGLSCTFLLSGLKSDKGSRTISRFTDMGEVKISLDSVEGMALASISHISGVRDLKVSARKHADCVSLVIRATVSPDINIPTICEDIQNKVGKAIEDCAGIRVNNVKIRIENVYATYKNRLD